MEVEEKVKPSQNVEVYEKIETPDLPSKGKVLGQVVET